MVVQAICCLERTISIHFQCVCGKYKPWIFNSSQSALLLYKKKGNGSYFGACGPRTAAKPNELWRYLLGEPSYPAAQDIDPKPQRLFHHLPGPRIHTLLATSRWPCQHDHGFIKSVFFCSSFSKLHQIHCYD